MEQPDLSAMDRAMPNLNCHPLENLTGVRFGGGGVRQRPSFGTSPQKSRKWLKHQEVPNGTAKRSIPFNGVGMLEL